MAAPSITPLPTPPSRSQSPTTFSADADAFLGALPTFQSEANAQADYLDGLAVDVTADADAAQAAAVIAAGAANYQGDYNAGTTYQIGESVSYLGRRYVAKTINTGVTPVDGANWFVVPELPAPSTAGNLLTSDGTNWTSAAPAPQFNPVNYPQNIQSADYTLVLDDAGKMIFHPAFDANYRTYTIPANASVAFPIGTVVLFTAENGGKRITVNIDSDTLVFGDGTTGSLPVLSNNTLMAIKVTATKWMANYLYQAGAVPQDAIAVGHDATPFISAYRWSGSGFGTKYANPAPLPDARCNGVAFSPSGDAIAVAVLSAVNSVRAYSWDDSTGFGARYTDPATMPASVGNGVAFSSSGDAIAVAHNNSPFITAYPWSGSGFGTKYANPATLPPNTGRGVAFSPTSDAIAIAHDSSPFISAYPWSGAGFGTKYANPATLPTGNSRGVAFSPSGDAIAVAHDSSPFISAYPWSGAGFGTKYANPATLPPSTGIGVAFSPAGDAIAVAHATSPFISAYPWSTSGFGTKYANPATLPPSTGRGVAFSGAGDAIAVAHNSSPFISAYPWSGSGFGTKYADPATLPASSGDGVSVAFGTQN